MNKEILQIKLGLNPYQENYISELKALPKEIKDEFKRHWELTKDYALDLRTGIKWFKATDENKYSYEEAIEKYSNSLPTKEEFEEAEKHGIRVVLEDFDQRWYWSSSVVSYNQAFSWYFYGTNGYVNLNIRNLNYSVRYIERPKVRSGISSKENSLKYE